MVARRNAGETWVVYRMAIKGSAGVNAVCTHDEWATMESARPGCYPLLRGGIGSENEAERLARGTSGDKVKQGDPRPAPGPAVVTAR
jgi:hypothetical protein